MVLTSAMTDILTAIQSMITSVVSWLTSSITSVAGIFYDSTNGFTFIGVLLLVAFGLGFVWTLVAFIKSLVKRG